MANMSQGYSGLMSVKQTAPGLDLSDPEQLRITDASKGKVDFELDITPDHTVSLTSLPKT